MPAPLRSLPPVEVPSTLVAHDVALSGAPGIAAVGEVKEVGPRPALGEKEDVLSELLAGLQRLEQNPPPALVVQPGDILAALRGAMLLGTIVPELQGEAELAPMVAARLNNDLDPSHIRPFRR